MLNTVEVSIFKDRISHLINQPENGIYVVSDVKSKQQFQYFLLQKKTHNSSFGSIMRSSDLFREIMYTVHPDYSVISASHLHFLFKTWSKEQNIHSLSTTTSPHFILHAFHSYLPILVHPEGCHSYTQWIKKLPPDLKEKRMNLFKSVVNFFKYTEKMKIVEQSCIKYFLVDSDLSQWPSPLTVDLSFSLDHIEAEIFCQLSRFQNMTFLKPKKIQNKIYDQPHKIYSLIEQKINVKPVSSFSKKPAPSLQAEAKNHQNKQIIKFQTMLDEIRFITEQIRLSLDSGMKPHQLAVVAPHIEIYWPCMKNYFEKEGIPFDKPPMMPFLSFPQIQKWLSSIRFYSNHISFENLENALLADKKFHRYSKFKNQYYHCDRHKDLERSDFHFKNKIEKHRKLNLKEFLKWILNIWTPIIKNYPNDKLDLQLRNELASLAAPFFNIKEYSFNQQDWVDILENFLSQREIQLQEDTFQGVACISLNAITSLQADTVYFIGLDHDSCQTSDLSLFSKKEAENILTDLGFYCFPKDPYIKEYEVINFLHSFKGQVTLSYSQTGLDGSHLQPSKIWLIENKKNPTPQPSHEPKTVWSSIQQLNSLEKIIEKNSSNQKISDLKKSLSENQHLSDISELGFPILTDKINSLSSSQINDYIRCPFIFLSKYIFHLEEHHPKDMDFNPLEKGRILHQLFEHIIRNQIQDPKEIEKYVESIKNDFDVMEEEVWFFYRDLFVKKACQLMEHEKENENLFPEIKTTATEISFKGYWNFKTKSLSSSGDILIKGRIDRIDLYKKEILIIDYKSKNGTTIPYWKGSTPDCQMPLYIQAVESKIIPLESSFVSGAIYLSYKNFKSKGFVLKNSDLQKTPHLSVQSTCKEDKKEQILKEVNHIINENILLIKQGFFKPQPKTKSTCERCQWNKICRAPHLH